MATIRCVLALTDRRKWKIRYFDVKVAFLNGIFKEEIFMKVLDGWENESTKRKVCRMKKVLYGLKQASRA